MFIVVGILGNEYEGLTTEILGYHEDKEICELKIEQFKELQSQIRDAQAKIYKTRQKMLSEKELTEIVNKLKAPLNEFYINNSWNGEDLDTFAELDFEIIEPEYLTI